MRYTLRAMSGAARYGTYFQPERTCSSPKVLSCIIVGVMSAEWNDHVVINEEQTWSGT